MNNEAAMVKIRICLFFWFAVYFRITSGKFLKWYWTIIIKMFPFKDINKENNQGLAAATNPQI